MAGIQTILCFNVTREIWVRSASEPSQVLPPKWYSGDVRSIKVQFVRDEPSGKVSVVTDIVSVQVGVGTPGTASLTSATSGVADSAYFYSIDLPFPKSATETFIGSTGERSTTLEFRTSSATGDQRYQTQVTLKKQLLSGTDADPSATDSPLGTLTAANLYVTKAAIAGEIKYWMSADGLKQKIQYLGNDGLMHYDDI